MVEQSQAHAEQNPEVELDKLNILILDHLTKAGLNTSASILHVSQLLSTNLIIASVRDIRADAAEVAAPARLEFARTFEHTVVFI